MLIITQAMIDLANEAAPTAFDPNPLSRRSIMFAVKGIVFLGVPHKGVDIADKASKILSMTAPLFNVDKYNVQDPQPNIHALKPVFDFLATVAADAIERDNEGHFVEDKFSVLESYDTVFLIDDSPSMRGEKWELVQKILDYSIVVVTRYDPDGVDVHFMNNTRANQDSIKDSRFATTLHHGIELRGNTPTLDRLSRHLKSYYQRFKAADFSKDFKGYNLIVLTDGEPNPEDDDESDLSDQDDARNHKPAFKLIRRRIVDMAKKLDEVDAERKQVGIQFCQVGNDKDATEFFQYLDDRIKGKNNLHRDVSIEYSICIHTILRLLC